MKKFVSIILAIIITTSIFSVVPITASAAETETKNIGGVTQIVASGTTGDCRWELSEYGTITIYGNGAMEDYEYGGQMAPWSEGDFGDYEIFNVIIKDGVTNVSDFAFSAYSEIESISIPSSVTRIGESAFENCEKITTLTIPEGVSLIGDYAFDGCSSLSNIIIPNTVTSIGEWAFGHCENLTSITIPKGVTNIGFGAFGNCEYLTIYGEKGSVAEKYASDYGFLFVETESGLPTIVDNGTTGECIWSLDDKGTLTISGKGAMGSASWKGNINIIKKVNIENGVTNISSFAFEMCKNLKSVTIPNTVKKIGNFAFNYCYSLTSVKTPDSVNSIGDGAFNSCVGLTAVELSNNISTISSNMFFECRSLENINIPEGVTTIMSQAFGCCTKLENITIPSSVTYIGRSAFCDCNIKEILIPDNVTSISDYAFADCAKLVRITIPDSVIDIESHAFSNCNSLIIYGIKGSEAELIAKENNIPFKETGSDAPVESDYSLMWSIDDYGTLTISGKGGIENYDSHSYSWSSNQAPWGTNIKSVIIENGITRIGDNAFERCDKLEDVILPDSLTSIGGCAFSYCNKLENITIPDSVKRINRGAFSNCSKMTSITIPDSVKNIDEYAIGYDGYYGVDKVNGFTIYGKIGSEAEKYANDNGFIFKAVDSDLSGTTGDCKWTLDDKGTLTIIGSGAMADYDWDTPWGDDIESVVIGDGVTSIGNYAFCNCPNLTSVSIPNSVTQIGDNAFSSCESLTSIAIPNGVTSIGDYAFSSCSNLEGVVIPNNVMTIGREAFSGCSKLESITIPEKVTSIGDNVFDSCESLESITVNPNNTTYDSRDNCNAIIETETNTLIAGCVSSTIPNGVTSIKDSAFSGCSNLKSISIPNSVKSIGEASFEGCSNLDNVTISNGVTQIGEWAFNSCSSLKSVTIPESITIIGDRAFGYYIDFDDYTMKKVNGFTIYGKVGSEAEKYANNNGFIFKEAGTEMPKLIGDVNGDNSIDVLDATVIQKYTVDKTTLNDNQKDVADVNDDGVVDILDATLIQKYAVDKITEFKKK